LNRSSVRFVLLGLLAVAALVLWHLSSRKPDQVAATPQIVKHAATVTMHKFDLAAPPADMPSLSGLETAITDTNFISDANVMGQSKRIDATHASVTVTGVKVTLELKINIWVPAGASQHVIEHEQGHREISEYYYRTANGVAAQVAAGYIGKQFSVSGANLDGQVGKLLEKLGDEITGEYNEKLNPNPAQQRYDDITDHSRYDIEASDAVSRVLKDVQ
jgi:hypothetical protein